MTYKQSANFRDLSRKNWSQPQRDESGGVAVKTNEDLEPHPRGSHSWGESPKAYDPLLWPAALRDLLESEHYQIAFLQRTEQNRFQSFEAEPWSTGTPEALLPFSWRELIAKVCESIRNLYSISSEAVTGFADVCVNFAKMEVSRAGEPVKLTAQEFKTLKFMMQNPERVISRDELLNEAWGYQNYPSTRTVDNHILKLRQKLERDPARPIHFLTIPRAGYKFVP